MALIPMVIDQTDRGERLLPFYQAGSCQLGKVLGAHPRAGQSGNVFHCGRIGI